MAFKRRRKTKPAALPAPRTIPEEEWQGKLKLLVEQMMQLARQVKMLEDQLGPLAGLQFIPNKADVQELRGMFVSLRVQGEEVRDRLNQLAELRSSPYAEFIPRAEFTAYKASIEERVVALERALHDLRHKLEPA